ncbi:nuclear protein MDM1 isoform X2 [Bufo gargarizans]|uniref:nuclear protein MDM1 isoform X2 n=1 Tax=Bufo gargarizans TaxID=30331 RepID=UPI001CF2B9C0|nr:nuclear protein MDM1 isoform X2 [Bufo gargarizans]
MSASLSEYDRNFKWRSYDADQLPMSTWAGLPSADLGITREPNFPSKRRVPYYNPQIGKTFNWKVNDGLAAESATLCQDVNKHSTAEEKIRTPEAPRLQKKSRSQSVPRKVPDNHSSAVPRIQPSDENEAVPMTQAANGSAPNNKEMQKSKRPQAPGDATQPKDKNGFHRVLQKKAGMNVAPSHHPLKISEYRRQFERKSPTENSPLLAAEQVIHNKNQSVPPFKEIKVRTDTEYKSQFQGSPPAKGPKLRKNWEEKHILQCEQESHSPKRKEKKKDVRKVENGHANMDAYEKEREEVNRKILKEQVLQQLRTPKYYRNAKTEYSSNFLSPSEYKYKDGAWVKIKNQIHNQGSSLSVGSMWVAEVKELRDKAEYYRHRAQGTHFSREHFNQIISNSNKLWDMSTDSGSEEDLSRNIRALDLAGLQTPSKKEKFQQSPAKVKMPSNTGHLGASDASTLPVRRKLVWDECDDAAPTENKEPLQFEDETDELEERKRTEEENTTEQHLEHNNGKRSMQKTFNAKYNPSEDESDISSVSVVEGRLPTPKLKTYGLAQRTHHDRTTPTAGGALLVSPSKHQDNSELKHIKSPQKTLSNGLHQGKSKKDEVDQPVKSPPVAGLMTVDPLPLREDPWPSPHISSKTSPAAITYPVNNPVEKPFVLTSQHWNPSCRIHGSLRDPEFQHNGNFNGYSFYNAALNGDNSIEDDLLSQISARSAASSSLASQVLERAQKRKQSFWGKK